MSYRNCMRCKLISSNCSESEKSHTLLGVTLSLLWAWRAATTTYIVRTTRCTSTTAQTTHRELPRGPSRADLAISTNILALNKKPSRFPSPTGSKPSPVVIVIVIVSFKRLRLATAGQLLAARQFTAYLCRHSTSVCVYTDGFNVTRFRRVPINCKRKCFRHYLLWRSRFS